MGACTMINAPQHFKAKAPVKEALHVVNQVFGQRPLIEQFFRIAQLRV